MKDWLPDLLSSKSTTKIGIWIDKTLYSAENLVQLKKEMKNYYLQILIEMRWTGSGKILYQKDTHLYYLGVNNVTKLQIR